MMNQFEILKSGGVRYLTIVDTTRYDSFIGFRRVIKKMED